MSEPVPHADFSDPLLKERSRRRTALLTASVRSPWFLVPAAAAPALYLVHPLLIPVAWVALLVVAFVRADRRADDEWWVALATHLGLEPEFPEDAGPLTPLLRSGDEREVLRAAAGGGRRLLQFRSTDVSHDAKGNRQETHHDYTVVLVRDPDPRIAFLSAHEHRVSFMKFLGDDLRGSTMRGVEEFKVESVELHDRFELRSSTADGERARQIFKPSFIRWFTTSGVPFEYEDGDLAVFTGRFLEHSAEYAFLLHRADQIHRAIRGERWEDEAPSAG